ncbi:MAG: hypothetical protein CMJ25_03585 [Phycisphaerae bacterium]|nr:hypothetical protein [Phycisphaerae bacterium]|tara:strand:- start:748 stop:1890 length:1143 start_codon:yes stop_codon:yes gene_type:complete
MPSFALKRYTGNGTLTNYTIPFTYRTASDVVVTVAGTVLNLTTHYSFPSASTISFVTPPANGAAIVLRRSTSQDARIVDYAAGSVLKESDLDNDSIQGFNMAQEAIDIAQDSIAVSDSNNQFDATSLRVTNVADPTSAQDVATKNYLETTWLSEADKTNINAVNNNLTNITAVKDNETNINLNATNITAIQNASANATLAQNYATETDSPVTGTTDDSAKSWATGGDETNYNMRTNGKGSAKEWAVYTTGTANDSEYSAKEYAVGTQSGQSLGSSKQWAVGGGTGFTTSEAVAGGLFSAKYYAEQAAASKTEFSNVYHGAAATDPTEDPDGSALEAGDLYFNTSTNTLKYYNGSSWASIEATDTSSFATKGVAIAMAIAL